MYNWEIFMIKTGTALWRHGSLLYWLLHSVNFRSSSMDTFCRAWDHTIVIVFSNWAKRDDFLCCQVNFQVQWNSVNTFTNMPWKLGHINRLGSNFMTGLIEWRLNFYHSNSTSKRSSLNIQNANMRKCTVQDLLSKDKHNWFEWSYKWLG